MPVTITQLRAHATVDLTTAARALGMGRTKAYQLARYGQFPCRIIRIGGHYRVPTPGLLELLGVAAEEPRASASSLADNRDRMPHARPDDPAGPFPPIRSAGDLTMLHLALAVHDLTVGEDRNVVVPISVGGTPHASAGPPGSVRIATHMRQRPRVALRVSWGGGNPRRCPRPGRRSSWCARVCRAWRRRLVLLCCRGRWSIPPGCTGVCRPGRTVPA